MSLKPSKPSSPVYNYHTVERTPSTSSPTKRPTPSRSSSSTLSLPSRGALIRTRTGELRAEQRPKLVSHPSGSNASRGSSGSIVYVTTPGATPQQQQQANSNPMKDEAKECCKVRAENSEDDDGEVEGSIVLVRVINAAADQHTRAEVTTLPATGQLVRTVGRALSADDARGSEDVDRRDGRRCYSGTALRGLTEAMKLESQLLLLKRELHLYQAFDEASGDIFIKSVHDDFFININQIMLDIVDVAAPLVTWTESRRHQSHALHIFKHLKTAHLVVGAWNAFYDWLIDISNKSIRFQREEGRVSVVTWERRRKECMETVERLLRLVGDVEMDEGVRGVLDMQNVLRRGWKADGMVGHREAERLGWVWGIRV